MSDRPGITDPAPGSVLDYSSGTVTFRWSQGGAPDVKKWWFSLGPEDGQWTIRNQDKQTKTTETIPVSDLPTSGKVWAQVYGTVAGKDANGNLIPDEDEIINSDPVWWNCP